MPIVTKVCMHYWKPAPVISRQGIRDGTKRYNCSKCGANLYLKRGIEMRMEDDDPPEAPRPRAPNHAGPITGHKVNDVNELLKIERVGESGPGGAYKNYVVRGENENINLAVHIPFHTAGDTINGITHEVLIEIVLDRLRAYQSGQFSCRENAVAITKLEEAQLWLEKRTRDRLRRGVEGTHTP